MEKGARSTQKMKYSKRREVEIESSSSPPRETNSVGGATQPRLAVVVTHAFSKIAPVPPSFPFSYSGHTRRGRLLTKRSRKMNKKNKTNAKTEPRGGGGSASGPRPQRPRLSSSATETFSASPLASAARALFRDGHTYWDGVLLVSACQIGQIMLVLPRATWLAGIVPASLVAVATLLCGVWTIHVLLALYLEYKARLLARGRWYEVEEGDEGRIGAEDGGVGGRGRGGGDDGDREIEVELELVNAKARAKACSSSSSSLAAAAAEEAELEPPPVPPPPPPRERKRLRVTQYHDVAGELGGPRCRALVVALTALTLFGVGVAQVLACSSNFYYISGKAVASASLEQRAAAAMAGDSSTLQLHARSKRDWALIWGLPMCLLLLVPGYRSSRFFSVLAIAGTTFTAWYVVAASAEELNRRKGESDPTLASSYAPPNLWPRSPRGFFVGGSVIMSALGAHTICMEVFEMLRQPVRFTSAFVLAQGYVWTLVAPQALAANVAFSRGIASVDTVYGERGGKRELKRERKKRERRGREEVFSTLFFFSTSTGEKKSSKKTQTTKPGVLPYPDWRMRASVWLMNVHQVLVFGFILMPLFYYAERACGVHARPFGPARAAARVPVVAAVRLVATAFPFYGGFNALFAAIGVPSLSFTIPCYLYNRTYLFSKGEREGSGEEKASSSSSPSSPPPLWARAAAARAAAPHPPPTLFGLLSADSAWKLAFALNFVLGTAFAVAGSGAGIYYSVVDMVAQASKWGVFAGEAFFFVVGSFSFLTFLLLLHPRSPFLFEFHATKNITTFPHRVLPVCAAAQGGLGRQREVERERKTTTQIRE